MKIVVNLLLVLVAIVVIGFGGILLFVKDKATQTQVVQIDRPPVAVFALLATTPENQALGTSGMTQTVTGFTHPSQVEAEIRAGADMKANALYTIAVANNAAQVTIEVSQSFGMNPIARLQGMKGEKLKPALDAAVAQLQQEAQRLKPDDFSGLAYEVVTVAPKPFLYLEASTNTQADRIRDGYRQAMNLIRTAFTNNNLQPAGNPYAVETEWQEGSTAYNFQFGIPYAGPPPALLIGVKNGNTPAGTAVKVNYVGAEETVLTEVYNKVDALLAATRVEESGPYFEIYNDDPTQLGGPRNREVYYIVTGDTARMQAVAPSAKVQQLPAVAPPAAPTVTPTPTQSVTPQTTTTTTTTQTQPAQPTQPAQTQPAQPAQPAIKVPAGPQPAPN